MKKLICLILILIFAASFIGCSVRDEAVGQSNKNEVSLDNSKIETEIVYDLNIIKKELIGNWSYRTKDGGELTGVGWIFNGDGRAFYYEKNDNDAIKGGTFEVKNGKIVISYESGETDTFIYSYSQGDLNLKTEDSNSWNLYKLR